MMLFYKAWRESRGRFIGGVLLLGAYCSFMILSRPAMEAPLSARMMGHSWAEYVNNMIWGSFGKIAFVLPVIFLGLGGLLRERAHRTAIFSLSLPVSRTQLIGAHLVIALIELGALALLPAVLIQSLSGLVHQNYSIEDSLRYCFLRFIGGAFIFAIAFLLSVVLRGEYTAPIASYMSLFVTARLSSVEILREYFLNPLTVLDSRNMGSSPWVGLAIMMLTSTALLATGIRITQKQNL